MSENAKNALQEHCQQNKLPLPVYTRKRGDDDLWYSTVEFMGVVHTSKGCAKKTHADISAAEHALGVLQRGRPDPAGPSPSPSPSHKALVQIQTQTKSPVRVGRSERVERSGPAPKSVDPMHKDPVDIVVIPRLHALLPWSIPDVTTHVIVDYENVNKLTHLHHQFLNDNGIPAAICKIVGHCNQKASTDEPSHVVKGQGSDAVDHFISLCVGQIIATHHGRNVNIVIVTRDMFGAHLENFSRDIPCVTVTHCASEKKAVEYLTTHGYKQTQVRYSYKDE